MDRFYYLQHIQEQLGRNEVGSIFHFGRNGQIECIYSASVRGLVEFAFIRGTALNLHAGDSEFTFPPRSGYLFPLNSSLGAKTPHRPQMDEDPTSIRVAYL